jgi:hypothetical protein
MAVGGRGTLVHGVFGFILGALFATLLGGKPTQVRAMQVCSLPKMHRGTLEPVRSQLGSSAWIPTAVGG